MPLASAVASHLPAIQAVPITHFPYPPPIASSSSRGSNYTKRKHGDDTRTHFHEDPLFKNYTREVNLLMGTTKLKDATVDPADWTKFKASARGALHQALEAESEELSKM